ncbi:MAG: 16S rRNA (guanine(966)-N(2))-methyltransferase RsmD [Thermodesulfobacteriota bacterium]
MRIIAGAFRGREVRLPARCRIRPTADRIKEALFNIVGSVEGKSWLDLFAGCGNVGLEALSRGASRAVFVEKNPRLAEAVRENLRSLGLEAQAEVIAADAETGMRRLQKRGGCFDILFADPPYEEDFISEILGHPGSAELLVENGVVILQHSLREPLKPCGEAALVVTDQRRYGDTLLSFLRTRREVCCR